MLNVIAFYIHIIDQVFYIAANIKCVISLSTDDPHFYSGSCIFVNIKNIIFTQAIQSYFTGIGGLKDPGCIVLDEIASLPITFFLVRHDLLSRPLVLATLRRSR